MGDYETNLIVHSEEVARGIKYYINRCNELKKQLENLEAMYKSRVNEYLELEKRTEMLEQQLALEMGCDNQ